LRFLPVDPGVASPGVLAAGELGCVPEVAAGLPPLAEGGTRAADGERPKLLGAGCETLSESTTSDARPKIYLLPTNPFISMYMFSLNSNGILLDFDKSFFSSLLMPHQLAEPVPSMYSLSFL
jgi:hypothetical protein